jgi:hypothetical protein
MKLDYLSNYDLVDEFIQCATILGRAVWDGDNQKAKQYTYRMKNLDNAFRERGPAVQSLMLPYLEHSDEQVRYSTAKRLLPTVPDKARACIEGGSIRCGTNCRGSGNDFMGPGYGRL